MYMIGIFILMIAMAVLAGATLFLISTIIVTVQAGAESVASATTGLARKVAASGLRHPKVPAVNPLPCQPTSRK